MNKYRNIILLLLLLSFCYSGIGQEPLTLSLEDAYKHKKLITTKDFIDSFVYLPLETSPDCLIGANPKINLTENYIVVTDQNRCLLFDRNNGRFIRQIGHYGKDPDGYKSTRGFISESTKSVYLIGWSNNLLKYSFEGKLLSSIKIPNHSNNHTSTFVIEKYTYLKKDLIVCNILNINGIQNTLLMVFDENGTEINRIPNRKTGKEHKPVITTGELNFFNSYDNLLYNEIYNDTIFHLVSDKTNPYIILDRGKYSVAKGKGIPEKDRLTLRSFFESGKFIVLIFTMSDNSKYLALYNKTNSTLRLSEIQEGILNDTDDFMPFLPSDIFNDELLGSIQPLQIIKWVGDNKSAGKSVPPALKGGNSINPTDNPVIVIGKLKIE
ncbi:MAG: DUF4934 domain-containing protein [Sedimentibacter sp.]|nr:DUF4934 domain-containing protein [Sedimentibacter sp.]